MPTINTGIKSDSQLPNLKEIQFPEVRPEVDIRRISSLISGYIL